MGDGLSYSEAGRIVGVSKQAISQAITDGKLEVLENKKVSIEAVLKWNTERRAPRGGKRRQVDDIAAGVADCPASENAQQVIQTLTAEGVFATRYEAEKWRDSFVARLRQVEYEREIGKLVAGDDVRAAITKACLSVRTKLLSLPSEQAPALHRLKTVGEVEAFLREIITEALESLVIEIQAAD